MSQDTEMLKLEIATLRRELDLTKTKLTQAVKLCERAAPLITELERLRPYERTVSKKLTIIEGLLWDWYHTKNGWTKFWATGAVLSAIREVIYAKES